MNPLPHDLDTALSATDAAGIWLTAPGPATLRLVPGWGEITDATRDTLRRHKTTVLDLVAAHPRPQPDPVWFVRRNLTVFDVPARLVAGQRCVWRSGKVYHRLTPAVLAYLDLAVARRLPLLSAGDRGELLARCGPLSDYCLRHYRPDQWSRAFAVPPAALDEPDCPAP